MGPILVSYQRGAGGVGGVKATRATWNASTRVAVEAVGEGEESRAI